jgi:hypothetical protein
MGDTDHPDNGHGPGNPPGQNKDKRNNGQGKGKNK